jgi:hypothetical protein
MDSTRSRYHRCGPTTLQGAAQFGRDVAAVAALLAPYTRRPLAYFRELADAATLLTLPADHVSIMTACTWSMAGCSTHCCWMSTGAVAELGADKPGQPPASSALA